MDGFVVPAKAGIWNQKPQKFIGKTETQKQRKPNGQDSRLRGNDGSYITQKKLKPNRWDSFLREADRCRLKDFQTA